MNIKEAKEVIIHAVKAYLDKDETGTYTIPPERQRPLLLMGPPGIGKTAIMEQVAQECGIGLVSYTITHHTRQSAIGLPYISKKKYGKKEYSVTEYTMSEIIAAVYDQIEASGVQEGILFLDEINCVSETLAPTMLQFLQYKTFGTHRVPDGFIIVTAGNPPQYNKSVRDFDIVTLDRLRRIDIEEDFEAFREYASRVGIHGSVMAYLGIRSNHFYSIRTEVEGRHFVTARGWEDLSRTIQVHEKKAIPVDGELAVQFLQDPEIARSFAAYYELYKKYKDIYRVPDILAGRFFIEGDSAAGSFEESGMYGQPAPGQRKKSLGHRQGSLNRQENTEDSQGTYAGLSSADPSDGTEDSVLILRPARIQEMQDAPFDEKLSLISLLVDALNQSFASCAQDKEVQNLIMKEMGAVRQTLKNAEASNKADGQKTLAVDTIRSRTEKILHNLQRKKDAGIPVSREEERVQRLACRAMEKLAWKIRARTTESSNLFLIAQYGLIKSWFSEREEYRRASVREANDHLTNAFRFLSRVYGEGQEMVLFLTELSAGYHSLRFINEHGNEAYFRYNRLFLLQDKTNALRDEVMKLMD